MKQHVAQTHAAPICIADGVAACSIRYCSVGWRCEERYKVEADKKDGGGHLLHLRPGISATVLSSFLQALKLISFIVAKSGAAVED